MEYRYLGRSGLKVSTITVGTMTFGGKGRFARYGETDVKGAREIIDLAVDHGVNVLDTANIYSDGVSEEVVGAALNGTRPGDIFITSKARMPVGTGPNDQGFSRYHLIRECERSLKRLRTDVIDIYLMHEWDGRTPLEEMLATLDALVTQGKIRYIGCSNFSGWHLMKSLAISDSRHLERFVTQQIHYTLEAREAEYELLPIAVDQGVGAMIWSPLAGGLLSGKYQRGHFPKGVRFAEGFVEPPIRDEDRLWMIVAMLEEIGRHYNVSAAQVALAWLLTRPGVSTLVVGGRSATHFRDNISAAGLKLAPEEIQQLNTISAPPLIYPYWHQAVWAKSTFSDGDKALFE